MAQTREGAEKVAAAKCGVPVDEYRRRVAAGEKHCHACRRWKPIGSFGADSTRYDGLAAICTVCRSAKAKAKRVPKARKSKAGERFVPAREGDKLQARARVNRLIKIGRLAKPGSLPCFDCGHTGTERRHEYDHFEGYSADKQECVQVVCSVCHAARSRQRGEIIQVRGKSGKFTQKGGSINGS